MAAADGRRFVDLNGDFTTLIHGHVFRPVVEVLTQQIQRGSCFANPTEREIELAELLCGRSPRIERVRFVNLGTEAVGIISSSSNLSKPRSERPTKSCFQMALGGAMLAT
ncbi:hypothetical protein [Bradyrhizobium sp. INPA03-11B]|uniref:hypothetical protein n=1 Tax=Bradyrhizobium sp. INPA03-11B TaxID=418598 RepID=UPI00338F0CD3